MTPPNRDPRIDPAEAAALWKQESQLHNERVYRLAIIITEIRTQISVLQERLALTIADKERAVDGAEQCQEAAVWYALRAMGV